MLGRHQPALEHEGKADRTTVALTAGSLQCSYKYAAVQGLQQRQSKDRRGNIFLLDGLMQVKNVDKLLGLRKGDTEPKTLPKFTDEIGSRSYRLLKVP